MIEYQAVMTLLEHLTASRLSAEDVEALLDAVAAVAEPVRLAFLWRPAVPDPDDDMVLEAAVNGQAEIVTFNVRDFGNAAERSELKFSRPARAEAIGGGDMRIAISHLGFRSVYEARVASERAKYVAVAESCRADGAERAARGNPARAGYPQAGGAECAVGGD